MAKIPLYRRGITVTVVVSSFYGCAATSTFGTSYATRSTEYERTAPSVASSPHDDEIKGPVLERAAYVRAVLRSNPTLESAKQAWRAALARVRQAGAFEDPMLDLGAAPLSIGSSKATFGYQVGISQKLPWFGKRSFDASIADAESGAAKSDYESMKRDIALTALVLYDQYFVADRSLEINAHHVELVRVMRDSASKGLETGRGSAQDALQAEGELAHMEHDTAILRSQRDVTIAQMNELLHRAPEQALPPPPKELPLAAEPDADTARLEAEAIAGRAEIAAARGHAHAEEARAERASREYYPDVTVSTSYTSMWDTPEHRWMVGLGFNLPVPTERRRGATDEAVAARARFESDAQRMTDAARTQTFVALAQLRESKHVLELYETRLLPIARDRVDAARGGFIASENPFSAVIDAEKNLRGIELDYQIARADCDRHRAELDRALGRMPGLDEKGASR